MTQPSGNTHTVMTWIAALMAIDALFYRNWVCRSSRRWIGMGDTSASGGLPKPPKTVVNNWPHAEHERAGRTSPYQSVPVRASGPQRLARPLP